MEVQGLDIGSLEYTGEDGEGQGLLDYLRDDPGLSPSRVVERTQLEQVLADAIRRIPPMERTVLGLYYLEELTLREIAQVVALHESRISHLKSQAILRLRADLKRSGPIRLEVWFDGGSSQPGALVRRRMDGSAGHRAGA